MSLIEYVNEQLNPREVSKVTQLLNTKKKGKDYYFYQIFTSGGVFQSRFYKKRIDAENNRNNIISNINSDLILINNIKTETDKIVDLQSTNTNVICTDVLYVSPNGDNSDGSSWAKAYHTIQDALNVASTDSNDCTLILISPNSTYYDINTIGDPTWTGNYILQGPQREFVKIKNDHASATSVLKFTGKTCIYNATIDTGETNNGLIIDGTNANGSCLNNVYFEAEDATVPQTILTLSGGVEYIHLINNRFHGVITNSIGLLFNNCTISTFFKCRFLDCLSGVQINNTNSDNNIFEDIHFHDCDIGIDINAGNQQVFHNIHFFNCNTNIDDEVGDHQYNTIFGKLAITTEPDNFTGISLATGNGANLWGTNTEIRASATSTKPFRITGLNLEADASEKFRIRLTADDGTTYFDDFQFEGVATGVVAQSFTFPSGSEFIFNQGTQIKASIKSESAGIDNCLLWLKIQEI